ncbi:hypothetical protein O3P69_006892 [Scylla paramamosain]|uniref:TNFR-Cys domain-containing protein n=2 Tax=Scylla paramamosain TaxID=85552 RepID=A0AAW0U1D9_SCYPA
MVGRGWWVLVWTVCAGWTVCVVCGGLTCQPGREFFSGRQGQCVPCTRCHDPQVVVVPCYVYQDAVCAPAAQFVPNWSQPGQPQPPITLSTSPAPLARDARTRGRHKPGTPSDRKADKSETISGIQGKSHGSKSAPRKNNIRVQDGATLLAKNDSKKNNKHPRHNHRHKHRQEFRPQNRSVESQTEESKVNSVILHEKSGANNTLDQPATNDNTGVLSRNSDGIESAVRDDSNGANSSNKTEESDLEQTEDGGWKETFFFAIIIVISVCLVVVTIVTLSHLRNNLTRRKLKRVYDGVPSESTGEARVMQQLLPSAPNGTAPVVATRGTVTYIRATSANSTPSSPTITTTTATMSLETQRTSGQVYPINPFTMDRLLEQRRVLGPASSVDTNLYIESWQQQDSQPAGHSALVTPSQCIPLRGSVSACPSPAPVRSYRTGPASASASPTVSVRGLNITRGHVRGGLAVLGGGGGGCS